MKSWIKNDDELKKFLVECGTQASKNMASSEKIHFEEVTFVDNENDRDLTFRVMMREDEDRIAGFIFPVADPLLLVKPPLLLRQSNQKN